LAPTGALEAATQLESTTKDGEKAILTFVDKSGIMPHWLNLAVQAVHPDPDGMPLDMPQEHSVRTLLQHKIFRAIKKYLVKTCFGRLAGCQGKIADESTSDTVKILAHKGLEGNHADDHADDHDEHYQQEDSLHHDQHHNHLQQSRMQNNHFYVEHNEQPHAHDHSGQGYHEMAPKEGFGAYFCVNDPADNQVKQYHQERTIHHDRKQHNEQQFSDEDHKDHGDHGTYQDDHNPNHKIQDDDAKEDGGQVWTYGGKVYTDYCKYMRALGLLGPDCFCKELDGEDFGDEYDEKTATLNNYDDGDDNCGRWWGDCAFASQEYMDHQFDMQ